MLLAFRQHAMAQGDDCIMEMFPQIEHGAPTWDAWRPAAVTVFGNWLRQIAETRALSDIAPWGFNLNWAIANCAAEND
jgi:hypothetical protein